MKKTICLAFLMLSSAATANELPSENVVMKALEKSLCPDGFQKTYRFTQPSPIHSYVLKDGKIILEKSSSAPSCPEGFFRQGSFCVELLCTASIIKEENK